MHQISNTLFFGSQSQMYDKALSLSREVLQVTDVFHHPDFYFYEPEKKSMGVDVASAILSQTLTKPTISERYVFLISSFDKFTVDAQNILLKMLEDGSNCVVLGLCDSDHVLPTVKSRMKQVYIKKLGFEDYIKECEQQALNLPHIRYYITDGDICQTDIEQGLIDVFMQVSDVLRAGNATNLPTVLGLVREKDTTSFYLQYGAYIKPLLKLIRSIFLDMCLTEIMKETESADLPYAIDSLPIVLNETNRVLEVCEYQFFGKDDFFLYISKLVHFLEGGITDGKTI